MGPAVEDPVESDADLRVRAYSTWDLDGHLIAATSFAGVAPLGGVFGASAEVQMGTFLGRDAADGLLVAETVPAKGSVEVRLMRLTNGGDLVLLATYSTEGTRVRAASSSEGRFVATASAGPADGGWPGLTPPTEVVLWDVGKALELARFIPALQPQRVVGIGVDGDGVWIATAYPQELVYTRRHLDRVATLVRFSTNGDQLWAKEVSTDLARTVDWFPRATAQAIGGVLLPPLSKTGAAQSLTLAKPDGALAQLGGDFAGAWDWFVRVEPDTMLGTTVADPVLRVEVIKMPETD